MSSRIAIGESFNPELVVGSDAFLKREFPMSSDNYRILSGIAYKESGIVLSDSKQEMVYSRLARRLRDLKIRDFDEYLPYVKKNTNDENRHFLNAITTNLTSFFRENHHFEHMRDVTMPMLRKKNAQSKKIRVWCAAASTGEEPYSIAMVLREAFPEKSGWDVKLLATDIDSNVLDKARAGQYSLERIESVELARKKKWFTKIGDENVVVSDVLKDVISFKKLNLLDSWPMKGSFDIVFCRNVIIYFDKDTQRKLFERVYKLMAHDAHLYVGHSESLHNVSKRFTSLGRTIYQLNSSS